MILNIENKKVFASNAGREFNISSPKQIQEIFYDELKLPVLKKTPKGQPSTNEDVMTQLAEEHELPSLILSIISKPFFLDLDNSFNFTSIAPARYLLGVLAIFNALTAP